MSLRFFEFDMKMRSGQSENPLTCCAICASPLGGGSALQRHAAQHNGMVYTLHHCTACDIKFWSPLKADPSVYEGEGFEAYADYHSGARPFPRWAEPLFEIIGNRSGRALDIGCGDGAVLSRLAASGFAPNGIDLDQKSIRVAREKFGLGDVEATTLEEYAAACKKNDVRFDLITFFEVLEHQDAPRVFLSQVRNLAANGCLIAGSVPNRTRFLAALDRKLGDGDLPPHHFLWFSKPALAGLLQSAGFEQITVIQTGALSYRQIVSKICGLIEKKARALPGPIRFASVIGKALSPIAALVPWLGMRISPSHLFFACRIPTATL